MGLLLIILTIGAVYAGVHGQLIVSGLFLVAGLAFYGLYNR